MSKIYNSVCPCKDCENKGCGIYHDSCQKYIAWKQDSIDHPVKIISRRHQKNSSALAARKARTKYYM